MNNYERLLIVFFSLLPQLSFGSSPAMAIVNSGTPIDLSTTHLIDTISGNFQVRNGFCVISCQASFDTVLSDDGSSFTGYEITNASFSGSFLCGGGMLTLDAFAPGYSGHPDVTGAFPVPVTITSACGTCNGNLDIQYSNADQEWSFDDAVSSCLVNGVMQTTSGSTILIVH